MSQENAALVALAPVPSPGKLGSDLADQLGHYIAEARRERGDVHTPEDTYPLIRSLVGSQELLSEYARVFRDVAKIATQELESELLDAAGEQDGMPSGSVTVPDSEGDIRLGPDNRNEYDIELTSIRAVIVALVSEVTGSTEAADLAIGQLLELGKFTPQVSKVREFARQLGRQDSDGLSAVVTGAIRKTTQYRGVKADRKAEA